MVDRDRIDAMPKINGALGRLGGLLKLWLSDDAKLNQFELCDETAWDVAPAGQALSCDSPPACGPRRDLADVAVDEHADYRSASCSAGGSQ
jgi:hypothetical protein